MAVKAKKAKEVKAHEVQAVAQAIPMATTVVREASGVDDVLADEKTFLTLLVLQFQRTL